MCFVLSVIPTVNRHPSSSGSYTFMATSDPSEIEALDAQRVDEAVEAIRGKDFASAERILLAVCENTPPDYLSAWQEEDGGVVVKFWDEPAFLHYVSWPPPNGCGHDVRWMPNAYPRAHYFLGFVYVAVARPADALGVLERGRELEPSNPLFNFEIAQALLRSGQAENALAFYDSVSEVGPHVSATKLAIAKRGRGAALIELKRLDEAQNAFRESLEFEPNNALALNELVYIEQLKMGLPATPGNLQVTVGKSSTGGPAKSAKWWQVWK